MDDGFFIIFIVILALKFGFLLWGSMGYSYAEERYQTEAVERGFAEYNQTTGEWQWKGQSDEQ